jgi:hypothetical protein
MSRPDGRTSAPEEMLFQDLLPGDRFVFLLDGEPEDKIRDVFVKAEGGSYWQGRMTGSTYRNPRVRRLS